MTLGPAAKWRPAVVPGFTNRPDNAASTTREEPGCEHSREDAARQTHRKRRNYLWSELMKRVFALDILECPRCFGRMRLVSAIHSTEALRRILDCLGLSSRAPPLSPIRPDIFLA